MAEPAPVEPQPDRRTGERRAARLRLTAGDRAVRANLEDQARSAFVRMVSHELRTPLNAVIGFSEILAGELYGPLGAPQYKQYAELVRDSGHKLLKLVNQTLEVVRLESGMAELSPGPEPLEPVLRDAALALRAEAAAKRLVWRLADTDGCPMLLADARALRSMLDALLQHAVAFSPPGGTVTVRTRVLTSRLVVEIADIGEGCEPCELLRLLRPFEHGETPCARKSAGAGLDLPIARLLAEASGGSLRLRSALSGGFTSVLSLPLA